MNGHGYAHPERIGIASHVGVVLDIPSIGVAQRLLIGNGATPGAVHGSTAPVFDQNEIIGMTVRTREGTKPVYVSSGYKVDLVQAVDIALKATITHRLTEPIWQADQWASPVQEYQSGTWFKKKSMIHCLITATGVTTFPPCILPIVITGTVRSPRGCSGPAGPSQSREGRTSGVSGLPLFQSGTGDRNNPCHN